MVWQSQKLSVRTCYMVLISAVRWVAIWLWFLLSCFCFAQASQVIRLTELDALQICAHDRHICTLECVAICPSYAKLYDRRGLMAFEAVREYAITRYMPQLQCIVAAFFLLWCSLLAKTTGRSYGGRKSMHLIPQLAL